MQENFDAKGMPTEEIRRKIVRASSWEQLFSSKEDKITDFMQYIIDDEKTALQSSRNLRQYRIESHPEGDAHVFEHVTPGCRSTFQELRETGDVKIEFTYPHRSSIVFITPDVGNVAHNFTLSNTILPKIPTKKLATLIDIDVPAFIVDLQGKPATKEWEDIMISNGCFPQRIGHRIFSSLALEAQARLLRTKPELFR